MIFTGTYASPLGRITLAGKENKLAGLWLEGQKYFASGISEPCRLGEPEVFQETRKWLDIYFAGEEPDFTPSLLLTGTPFQKAVWEILLTIPYGKTMTYGEIAERIAKERKLNRMSAQAVGGAVGRNPVSLIVPCHRVVGRDGSLTGYAGGIEKKRVLLELEKHLAKDTGLER